MCHAVDQGGESANPDAPAFRDLSLRLTADTLSQLVTAGLMSGHPRMPDMRLDAREYGDLAAYINALKAAAPRPGGEAKSGR